MTDFSEDIDQCLETLRNGGIILYPTDTVWGLGCDATNTEAVKKLCNLKHKPAGRGLIVLLADKRDVLQYAASPDLAVFDYLAQAKKPTTVIYEHGLKVVDEVLNEDGSIAIRLITEPFCRHLLKRLKKPLVSTSANLHGEASPQHFQQVANEVINGVDYVVKYRQDDVAPANSSAIISWQNGEAKVIRP